MKHRRRSTLWPYLGLFTCLLVSMLLPRYWGTPRTAAKRPQVAYRPPDLAHMSWEPVVSNVVEIRNSVTESATLVGKEVKLQDFLHHLASPLETASWPPELHLENVDAGLELSSPLELAKLQANDLFANQQDGLAVADSGKLAGLAENNTPYNGEALEDILDLTDTELSTEPVEPAIQSYSELVEPAEASNQPDTVAEAVVPRSARPTSPANDRWPPPVTLVQSLHRLSNFSGAGPWSKRVLHELDELSSVTTYDDEQLGALFDQLAKLAREGRVESSPLPDGDHRATYIRSVYGLEKRLELWQMLHHVAVSTSNEQADYIDPSEWQTRIAAVQKLLGASDEGQAWSKFLLLDELAATDDTARCQQAEQLLNRMSGPRLTPVQRTFVERREIQELVDALNRTSCQSVGFPKLLGRLEQYEQSDRATDGEFIAGRIQLLLNSGDATLYRLGNHLDRHWRNANVRMSMSSKLMNRYLPNADTVRGRVQNRLGDATVRGTSWTTTEMSWNLVPDDQRIRVELVTQGHVRSETIADQRTARTQNRGRSHFEARKPIWFDRQGLHTYSAVASANSSVHIRSIETNYDRIPLIGSFARALAQSRAEQQKYRTRQMMQQRVVQSAKRQLNTVVDHQLSQLVDKYETNILEPLVNLGLEPTPVTLQTTDRRIVARYRLAGQQQLAAWSARPLAFVDTLLSVQIHQSAINNLIEKLKLNGKRFDLEEIYRTIPQQLGFESAVVPDDLPENVNVQFAAHEPVRFRFKNGRVRIAIRLASLTKGQRYRWRNLTVMGDYVPDTTTVNASLVREESIQLTGNSLNFSDQIVLRGIFSNVLSKKRRYTVMQDELAEDQRVKDLGIQEFVVEDGWIGIAWGVPRLVSNSRRSTRR